MWPVYRRYHLLIVGQRDDERSGALHRGGGRCAVALSARSRAPAGQRRGRAAHRRAHRHRSAGRRDHAGRERRGALSCQAAVRRYPRSAAEASSSRSGATFWSAGRISWPGTLTCWRRRSPRTGTRFPLPPARRTASCPRIADRTPFSPAKRCRMTEGGRTASTFRGAGVAETSTPCRQGVCVLGSPSFRCSVRARRARTR